MTSAVEHVAVSKTCEYLAKYHGFELTVLPVNEAGSVSVETLQKSIRDDTILVRSSSMHTNTKTHTHTNTQHAYNLYYST